MLTVRTTILSLALLTTACALAQAQKESFQKVDLYGGYSYLHSNPGPGVNSADSSGWDTSLNFNVNRWFGIKADMSGAYCCSNQTEHNFLFGPQLTWRLKK